MLTIQDILQLEQEYAQEWDTRVRQTMDKIRQQEVEATEIESDESQTSLDSEPGRRPIAL